MADGERGQQDRVDTTRLQGIARAYTRSAVLYTAIDVELFTHVHRGANTEAALVAATGLRPRASRATPVPGCTSPAPMWRTGSA
jgi:hypothetical protein